MKPTELKRIEIEARYVGLRCLELYHYSHGPNQYQTHYVSPHAGFQWFFWK
jgi:hypothetical protein